jgi:hypothetical protein
MTGGCDNGYVSSFVSLFIVQYFTRGKLAVAGPLIGGTVVGVMFYPVGSAFAHVNYSRYHKMPSTFTWGIAGEDTAGMARIVRSQSADE